MSYRKCDLVKDRELPRDVLRFIKDADLLTLVKSFSAVDAFFRNDPNQRKLLRNILSELKQGCLVLFIDNDNQGDTFKEQFASPAGLDVVFECHGKASSPPGQYSGTTANYCRRLDFRPMRSCDVKVRIFRKHLSIANTATRRPNEPRRLNGSEGADACIRPSPRASQVDFDNQVFKFAGLCLCAAALCYVLKR